MAQSGFLRKYLLMMLSEIELARRSHKYRAIQVNIEIMRVRLRQMLASHAELAPKLDALEKKYDAQFKDVFEAIRQLMAPPEQKRRAIGFRKEDK